MTSYQYFDAETKAYFDSLPAMIQENIIYANVEIASKRDLEEYYQQAMAASEAAQQGSTS